MASSQRTIDQAAGTAPTIGIAVDERTHYAHARYAMIDEPGVIWYDPRDGHEKFQVPNTPAGVDLSLGERVLTHVTIHAKRARCQVVDPTEHEWVVEYQFKTREVFERPSDLPDREYTAHYARSETYDTVREARVAAGERCAAYAEAEYRNAVEERAEGELVTDGGRVEDDGKTYRANGRLRSAERERELIRLALNDANSFAFWAPHERDWWMVFCESIQRHWDEAEAVGQRSISDFNGGASA